MDKLDLLPNEELDEIIDDIIGQQESDLESIEKIKYQPNMIKQPVVKLNPEDLTLEELEELINSELGQEKEDELEDLIFNENYEKKKT